MSAAVTSSSQEKIKKKKKDKGKATSREFIEEELADDAQPVGSSYRPPEGAKLLTTEYLEDDEFDYDKLKNDEDLELWLIRIPEGIKAKHLKGLQIPLSSSSKTTRLGTFSKKHTDFDIWSVGEDGDEGQEVGAEELKGLSALVPRKKKGQRLFTAPKPFTKHIVLTARPVLPTPPISPEGNEGVIYTNPPRYRHPQHLLKHRFMPYGSLAVQLPEPTSMDVDGTVVSKQVSAQPDVQASPRKKRKEDTHIKSPKNSKQLS